MKFKDKVTWDKGLENNTDPYGAGVYIFAESWADLMGVYMSDGESVAECADKASREADTSGITGFMYGCAVAVLSKCWEHGEELRRWHNLDTQIGNEGEKANESGGCLNPALLNISVKEEK